MKYFSTFTGIGGFELAIHREIANAKCVGYSEIDKFAEKTYLKNYPARENLNFGDIERLVFDLDSKGNFKTNEARVRSLPDFDLLVGGSPCQDLSIAKAKRAGLDGKKSRLFFAYLEILRIKKPKYFILENVASMSADCRDQITQHLYEATGKLVEPMMIDARLVSAQKRKRYYWFPWKVEQPKDINSTWDNVVAWSRSTRYPKGAPPYVEERETRDGKANTLTTGKGCASFSSKNYIENNTVTGSVEKRILTPAECEDLQCFPIGWTHEVSETQRYKQIGNAVNVRVVQHILTGIEKQGKLL